MVPLFTPDNQGWGLGPQPSTDMCSEQCFLEMHGGQGVFVPLWPGGGRGRAGGRERPRGAEPAQEAGPPSTTPALLWGEERSLGGHLGKLNAGLTASQAGRVAH